MFYAKNNYKFKKQNHKRTQFFTKEAVQIKHI